MRDQGSKGCDQGSETGWDQGSQVVGSESAVLRGNMEQSVSMELATSAVKRQKI